MVNALRFISFGVLVALVIGFALFVGEAGQSRDQIEGDEPGIVVLTGGENRVSSAVRLLEQNANARLLISGAHPDSSPADIAAAAGASADLFACCVDTGFAARDTIGNASETALWVEANGFDRLIVVTNDYHMPRALLELQAVMPDTRLIAYGVESAPPYQGVGPARRWLQEYLKYVAVYVRVRLGF